MAYANSEDRLSALLGALADPTRRAIYNDLAGGPKSVSAIAKTKPVSRPAVSQHLKVLETAELVSVSTQGSHRIYSARKDGLEALRNYLDTMWDENLQAFAAEISRRNKLR